MTPTEAPSPYYPRMVEDPNSREKCFDCSKRSAVQMLNGIKQEVSMGPDPRCPFCEGSGTVPRKVKAQSPAHHAAIVGYPVGQDGERLRPAPPTVEEVIKAGYAKEAAPQIAAEEAAKAAMGIKPYGDLEPTTKAKGSAATAKEDPSADSIGGIDPLAPEF